jgi:hypothetical protein
MHCWSVKVAVIFINTDDFIPLRIHIRVVEKLPLGTTGLLLTSNENDFSSAAFDSKYELSPVQESKLLLRTKDHLQAAKLRHFGKCLSLETITV